ncbi:MAG: hypothetical protein QE263_07155 [Vampirovibrionales bacterium]|nr:hypothetical protein [Vampirovibrionales bacterium]
MHTPVFKTPVTAMPQPKTRFGYAPVVTPWMVSTFDYNQLGQSRFFKPDTPTHHSMFIYFWLITSRIAAAFQRGAKIGSQRETAEHALRDACGYAMWFFGSTILNRLLSRVFFGKDWKALYTKIQPESLKRFWGIPLNPNNLFHNLLKRVKQASHYVFSVQSMRKDDIEAYAVKRIAEMRAAKISAPLIETFEKKMVRLARNSGLAVTLGIVFNIALMGFGIPYINILFTKRAGARLAHTQNQKTPPSDPIFSENSRPANPFQGSNPQFKGQLPQRLTPQFQQFSAKP